MTYAILSHDAALAHETPPGHPERVRRFEAVAAALAAPDFADARRVEAPLVTREALLRAHLESYLSMIERAAPETGSRALDPDTHMSPGTLEAALRAAGAAVRAVDMVVDGEARAAFSAMRPPGHHAERARAMGFCLFSNAAIAALHALETRGLARVAVADFDVHHGNGTQDVLERDARAVFCSSHQWPLYPGTGHERETGVGNIFNATLPAGAGSAEFEQVWEECLLPAINAHAPELIIISAGFDAHRADPLAELMLEEADFAWITGRLCDLAAKHCGGRVVSLLEGGYDLGALAASVAAHVGVLKERAG